MMLYRSIFLLGCLVSLGIEATLLVTQWVVPTSPLTDTGASIVSDEGAILMMESSQQSVQGFSISQFHPEQTELCTTVAGLAAHPGIAIDVSHVLLRRDERAFAI